MAEDASAPVSDLSVVSWAVGDSDIALDPAWRTGTLANGLRYAVRENGEPASQLAMRVRVGVGGLMEADDQQGWTHLIEHMVFRGEDEQGNETQTQWQRLGIAVGRDNNATTGLTQTAYQLDLPNPDAATYRDALTLLSGVLRKPSFDPAALANEKQIVMSERALRLPPLAAQLDEASRGLFLAGLKASERDVIGTEATIGGADADRLQAFHATWYRPSNMQVVVVGPLDAAVLEQAVHAAFDNWSASQDPLPQTDFGSLASEAGAARAVVHPQAPAMLQLSWSRPHAEQTFTKARQRQQYVERLAVAIVGQRLAEESLKAQSIVNVGSGFSEIRHVADQMVVQIVPRAGDWRPALEQAFGVINALASAPPSQAEIDQQAASIRGVLAQSLASSATRTSPDLAQGFVRDIDQGDISGSRAFYLELFDEILPSLTPQVIGETLQGLLASGPQLLVLSPEPLEGGDTAPQLALAQAQAMGNTGAEREQVQSVSLDQLELPQTPGQIASTSVIEDLGIEQVTFANGVILAMKQTGFEQGAISLQLLIGSGVLDREPNDSGLYWTAGALGAVGVGPLGPQDLARIGAGRQIGFGIQPASDSLRLVTKTNAQDLADALKLMTGMVTQPRFSEAQVDGFKAQIASAYPSLLAAPATVLQVFSPPVLHGGDMRFAQVPELDLVQAVTFDQFAQFWTGQLDSRPLKLVVVGDFDREALINAVAGSLGALPQMDAAGPTSQQLAVTAQASTGEPISLLHRGDPAQMILARIFPTTGVMQDTDLGFQLRVTASIIQSQLFEQFRGKDGGGYQVFANSVQSIPLPEHGYLMVGAQIATDREVDLAATIDRIVSDLAANGPEADALARAKQTQMSIAQQLLNTNNFWQIALTYDLDDPRSAAILRNAIGGIEAIGADDVQQVAQTYFAGRAFDLRVVHETTAGE